MGRTTDKLENADLDETTAPQKKKLKAKLEEKHSVAEIELTANAVQLDAPKKKKTKLEVATEQIKPEEIGTARGRKKQKGATSVASTDAREEKNVDLNPTAATPEIVSADNPVKIKASKARRHKRKLAAAGKDADTKGLHPGKAGTVFVSLVGGMDSSFDREAFQKFFAECGQIVDLSIPMRSGRKNREAAPRGIAFITFSSKKGVKRALAKKGSEFNGQVLKVQGQISKEKKEAVDDRAKSAKQAYTVFVKNLPHSSEESEVWAHFRTCGNIAGCRILIQKGIAFVRYKRKEGFERALELNEQQFRGRVIYVEKAHSSARGSDKDGNDDT